MIYGLNGQLMVSKRGHFMLSCTRAIVISGV